ncbi:MAG: rhodanese [Deltaproteobacteria bacterium]|nr:rhodanese [Deltaproteobacteria bacterium]MBN2686761.1 rhodanese [Deltaproteobacteria bacterium]
MKKEKRTKKDRPSIHAASTTKRTTVGFREGLLLLLIGIAIGTGYHVVTPSGLSWFGNTNPSVSLNAEGIEEIALDDVWSLYRQKEAVFLDARDPDTFWKGHIPGALNIPPPDAEHWIDDIRAFENDGKTIISYCDGVACPLGEELALNLREKGVQSVKVLINGWSRWRAAGHPEERLDNESS